MEDKYVKYSEGLLHDKEIIYDANTNKPIHVTIYRKNNEVVSMKNETEIQLENKNAIKNQMRGFLAGISTALLISGATKLFSDYNPKVIDNNIRTETQISNDELRSEIKSELKEELKNELKEEIKTEVQDEIELNSQKVAVATNVTKSEIPEYKTETTNVPSSSMSSKEPIKEQEKTEIDISFDQAFNKDHQAQIIQTTNLSHQDYQIPNISSSLNEKITNEELNSYNHDQRQKAAEKVGTILGINETKQSEIPDVEVPVEPMFKNNPSIEDILSTYEATYEEELGKRRGL